jgi:phage-related protein
MADNIGDQFNSDLSKLSEQVNKLVTALGSVTKDSTDSLNQMKKQIQLCTNELLNMETVSSGANDGLKSLRQQLNEATKKYNEMVAENTNNGKLLEKITEESNDTGEKIGELLRTEKNALEMTRGIYNNTSTTVELGKKDAEARAEEAREKKAGGKSGAEHLGRDMGDGKYDKEEEKERREKEEGGIGKFLLGLPTMLVAIAGFLFAFVKGASQLYINFFKQMFQGIASGAQVFIDGLAYVGKTITTFAQKFVSGIFTSEGALFKPLMDALKSGMKSIDNFIGFTDFYNIVIKTLSLKIVNFAKETVDLFSFIGKSIAKPFVSFGKDIGQMGTFVFTKMRNFFMEIDSFVQFASKPLAGLGTKFTGFFKGIATYIGGIFTKVEGVFSLFGEVTGLSGLFRGAEKGITNFAKVFATAGKIGAKLVSLLPLISVIPTIIETIVSAFGKFDTEGFKGVFKSIIVGLLKGIASFFTLGLSDLVLDFDKMYETISKPLDGLFDQITGIVKIFGDVFGWIIDTLVQVYNGFLKPLVMSLWENALKPLMGVLGAVADVLVKVVSLVLKLLTPVFSIVKFIFKVIFEVVKVIFDLVIMPIMKTLLPVFQVVFSVIGFLFNTMKIGFEYMSEGFQYILDAIDPAIADITAFFDDATNAFDYLGQVVDEFMQPVLDMFSSLAGMISEVWTTLVGKFKPLLSWLGIDMGTDTRSTRGMTPSVASGAMASSAATSPAQMQSAAARGGSIANSTVMVTHAPTTNNVVNGGGGGGAPVVLSPNPVRHADPTRHMIGH